MNEYQTNLSLISRFMTRSGNELEIQNPSFWLNDVTQNDKSKKIEIEFISHENWLKIRQSQGHLCTLFPIDGSQGVFLKEGLPISDIEQFTYMEVKPDGTKDTKTPGDCDCLILDEKWRFLEFKTDATSLFIEQANNNRAKGEAQLAKSMTSFKEKLNEPNLKYECVLVVPKSFPREKASSNTRNIKFLKRFRAPLIEITTSGTDCYDLN